MSVISEVLFTNRQLKTLDFNKMFNKNVRYARNASAAMNKFINNTMEYLLDGKPDGEESEDYLIGICDKLKLLCFQKSRLPERVYTKLLPENWGDIAEDLGRVFEGILIQQAQITNSTYPETLSVQAINDQWTRTVFSLKS